MPNFPIVDTHLHIWDPSKIRYSWLDGIDVLNRPYLLSDYNAHTQGVDIEAMVFVQCEADPPGYEQEAAWVAQNADTDPRLKGMVAWAPLEKGAAVAADLERLKQHKILRGIRRIIQFEPDLDFCLSPDFIEGVRSLRQFDLSFDICIDHRHMANVIAFAGKVDTVPMILDHIGKPAIKDGALEPWRSQMFELAQMDHVICKLSGVATEADHGDWTVEQLRPFVDAALEAFGFDRVAFGGDWPVAVQAIAYPRWVEIVDEVLKGESEQNQRKVWRDNANRFYRLGL
ncbi:MAG: amidohydrolase family protein [Pseudomonadota bacterium]